MLKRAFVDVDDLWTPDQITRYLVPLKEAVPKFRLTCYSIPNRLGPVHDLKREYPWISFTVHGWEHTPFECRAWTDESAKTYLQMALDMGYERVFKAPNWTFDDETEAALADLGFILHHHPTQHQPSFMHLMRYLPGPKSASRGGYVNLHTHIQPNPVTDSILTHPAFRPERLAEFEEFLLPQDVCVGGL